jgi:hypothetical protein|tara:strand:+ start:207 stop:398 length:192 start_codon:yes stop_codon:yes gene_type:complete
VKEKSPTRLIQAGAGPGLLWWVFLARLTDLLHQRVRNGLDWINKISAGIFLVLGVAVLANALL